MAALFGIFGGLAVAAAALLAWLADVRGAMASVLVAIGAFALRGADGRPGAASPRRGWAAFAAIAAGLAILTSSALPVAGLAALFVFKVLFNRRLMRTLGAMEFEPAQGPAIMPGAERLVGEFAGVGFEAVGAHRCSPAGHPITVTVMLHRQRDRVALVTDRVWQVVSQFDGRWLVTTNSGLTPLPLDTLRQEIPDGPPLELAQAHEAALELAKQEGLAARRFDDAANAVRSAVAIERHALAFLARPSFRTAFLMELATRPAGKRLDADPDARRRIETWVRSALR